MPGPRWRRPTGRRRNGAANLLRAFLFLLPALLLLGALVVYPIVYSVVRSLYGRSGSDFVGLDNYQRTFESASTLRALRNTAIWVVVAPTLATAIGLVFAVLSERVRWHTAFKVAVFMPMAISFLAAGVIFRFVYEQDPSRGVANAVRHEHPGRVPTTRRLPGRAAVGSRARSVRVTAASARPRRSRPGDVAPSGLVAIRPEACRRLPSAPREPSNAPVDGIRGVVWLDFTRGGGGERGAVDPTEQGLPGMHVQAFAGRRRRRRRHVSDRNGTFTFTDLRPATTGSRWRPTTSAPRPPESSWLGPALVTPSIIASYLWIWVGFSMIVIGAGLAAIPREVLEAARTDGANEWQVFRRVTAPLLRPVLLVVLITLMINVLKVFDLVFVIAPPSVQDDANVLALEMWRVSFGGAHDQGLGSALAILLFVLVVPAMLFNIRRLRVDR